MSRILNLRLIHAMHALTSNFIIHSPFEHDLSYTRANGSPSEEPDSALSDGLTVHRNGTVWSHHDSGSRACSGGVGSCSY